MKFILNEGKKKFILNEAVTFPLAVGAELDDRQADWAALYAECTNSEDFEVFWHGDETGNAEIIKDHSSDPVTIEALKKGYYSAEFGVEAENVEDFGKTFTDDLLEYGFGPKTNALLALLKYKGTLNGGGHMSDLIGDQFDQAVYKVFHEAMVKYKIQKSDILGPSSKFAQSNIIFNRNLYDHTAQEISSYIDLQAYFVQNESNISSTYSTDYSSGLEGRRKLFANVFHKSGNLSALIDAASLDGTPLRAISEIKELIQEIMPGGQKEKTSAGADIATEVEGRLLATGIGGDDKEKCQKALAFLVDYWTYNGKANMVSSLNKKTTPTLEDIRNTLATTGKMPKLADVAILSKNVFKLDTLEYSSKQ